MHSARLFLLAFGLALGGCSSGQTGSPDCVGPEACVCDPLYGAGTLLRVHVERVDAGKLEAVVDEVFAPLQNAHNAEVGDRVGGSVLAEQPCARDAASSISVGSELLVLYSAGFTHDYPNCSTFQDCATADCANLTEPALSDCWNACDGKTSEFCAKQRGAALLDGVFSWAIPWSDTLSFGAARELPSSEISVLYSHESCVERFPADPAPPCNDVVMGHCSTTPRQSAHGVSSWALLLGLMLVGGVRREVRRRGLLSR